MVYTSEGTNKIPDEVKDYVVDYYMSGIPEELIAIYTGLEVFDVISILKDEGLYEKLIHTT